MKNIRDAARAALDVQSACNLSGVVHSFSQAMTILRAHPECSGTDWANRHPISVLFAVQVGYLSGVGANVNDYNRYNRCWEECERLSQTDDEGNLVPPNLMSTKDIYSDRVR